MQRGIGRQARIATQEAQHKALTESLTAPPVVGPDGMAVHHPGHDAAGLIMSVIGEMRRDMGALAQAFNAPKQLIRDPQSGEIVGIAPMGAH
jgi:hypothetical protein